MIDVLIPCYNTNLTLFQKTINSILNNKKYISNIIICDDGSTNEELIKWLKQLEENTLFKVIYNSHSGITNSIYTLVTHSKSDYLCFIDSDDYIDENYLYRLISEIEENDLLCSGYRKVINLNKEIIYSLSNQVYKNSNDMKFLKEHFYFNNHSFDCFQFTNVFRWSKLYRSSIAKKIIEEYKKANLQMYEDMLFNYLYICNASSVKVIDYVGYNYFQYSGSFTVTKSYSILKMDSMIKNIQNLLIDLANEYDINEKIFSTLYFDIAKYYLSRVIKGSNYKQARKFFKDIRKLEEYKKGIRFVNKQGLSLKRKIYLFCLKHGLFLPIYFNYKKMM